MPTSVTLDHLHDLALLFFGLAHHGDAHLHPAEKAEMLVRLRGWQPDRDPALLLHVLHEAALTYLNAPTQDQLDEAARGLKAAFRPDLRARILHDLDAIAEADGQATAGENAYVAHLRGVWEV